jgi:hypothetical protein
MVAYNYNFEAGVDGADTAAGGGTDGGGDIPTSRSVGASGTMKFSSASAMHGAMGCAMTTTASTVAMFMEYNVPSANRYTWRTYIRFSSLPGVRTILGRYRSSAATPATIISMSLSTINTIGFYNAAGTWIDEGTVALAANTIYRIEFAVDITAATVEWKLFAGDSTTVLDTKLASAVNVGVDPIGKIRFGRVVGSTWIGTIDWDDWNVQDLTTGFPGPLSSATTTVRPTSIVSNPGVFTSIGGASSLFAALADEADTTYIQSPANPSGTSITLGMPELSAGTPTVTMRHAADVASPVIGVTYDLLQGTTVVSTRTIATLPTTITDYSWTATSGETAVVTDRTQLRVRVTTSV